MRPLLRSVLKEAKVLSRFQATSTTASCPGGLEPVVGSEPRVFYGQRAYTHMGG